MTFSATDGSGYPKRKVAVGGTSLERVQFEAEEAVFVHTEETDPHPVYTTAAENNLVYSKLPHTHGPIPMDSESVEDPLIPQPFQTFTLTYRIDGKLMFGQDTNLYRSAADTLKTDDAFIAAVRVASAEIRSEPSGGAWSYLARDPGDATWRWTVGYNGTLSWGDGAAGTDTNLYRSAANVLKTDDTFIAQAIDTVVGIRARQGTHEVEIGSNAAQAQINFGSGADTNLYRSAADTLKTDDVFEAAVRVQSPSFQTTNVLVQNAEEQSGGLVRLYKASATLAVPGDANLLKMYVRPGTNANTLKLVVIAGTAGTETTILDNIST